MSTSDGFRQQIKQACDTLADTLCTALEDMVNRITQNQPGFTRKELEKHLGMTSAKVRSIIYGPKKDTFARLSILRRNGNNKQERVYAPQVLELFKQDDGEKHPTFIREKALKLYLSKDLSFGEIAQKLDCSEPTVSSHLARIGILSPHYIGRHLKTLDDVMGTKLDGFRLYGKEQEREEMIGIGAQALQAGEPIGYLGLEGPNFTSYVLTSRAAPLDPRKSLIAEHDRKAYHLMLSIVRAGHLIEGGKAFKGLNLYRGGLESAIRQPEFRKHQYGWLNLDYEGGWAPEKARTISALFESGQIAPAAVLFLTLNNEPRMRAKCDTEFGHDDQTVIATQFMDGQADGHSYACELIHERKYVSKITNTKPMLLLGYKLTRK